MGILNFLKPKSNNNFSFDKKLLSLKSKRINYVYQDFNDLINDMNTNIDCLKALEPVNYYAIKNIYIEGQFFYSVDYSECYVKYLVYENDSVIKKSKVFQINYQLLSYVFAKVGIIINNVDN